MKKHINLILKQKRYQELERIFGHLRSLVVVMIVVFFVLSIVYFFVLSQKKSELNALNSQKKQYLDYLLQNKEIEAKFVYFNSKEKNISTILQNDVNFYPYYNVLVESLKNSSPAATLETVLISKDRTTDFTLNFPEYNSLLSFFKFIESDIFLKNFSTLNLISLSTTNQDKVSNGIKMNFKGKFLEQK